MSILAWATRRLTRRSEEHTSELQSRENLVCRLLLEKKNTGTNNKGSLKMKIQLFCLKRQAFYFSSKVRSREGHGTAAASERRRSGPWCKSVTEHERI